MSKKKDPVLVTYPEMTIEVIGIPNYHLIFFRHSSSRIIYDQQQMISKSTERASIKKKIKPVNQNL